MFIQFIVKNFKDYEKKVNSKIPVDWKIKEALMVGFEHVKDTALD